MTDLSFNTRVAREMRSAFEAQKNGALIGESDDAKRLVFFEAGHIVGAKSDLPGERLGEILVREGRVSQPELEKAMRFIRSGRKLGHILVELGYLKGGEIEHYVRLQIVEIAGAILVSTPSRLLFSDQVPVEAVTLSPVSIADVFLEAAKRLSDIEIYRENVFVDDYILTQTDDALALAVGTHLSQEESHVLDLVDSRNTVREILALSPLNEDETVRILIALHQSGMVALREKKATIGEVEPEEEVPRPEGPDPFEQELTDFHNAMQCQNHWEVLGLRRGASYTEVDKAYRGLMARFDPEECRHTPDGDFQEKLSSVVTRLKEAFVTLSSQTSTNVYRQLDAREGQYQETKERWQVISAEPVVPTEWERAKDPEEAKRFFKQAQMAYKEHDYWRAIELCRTSIEMDDEQHADRFHLLGKSLSENPRWRQDAEQNLKIAHKLKPWEPRYLVSLGKLYEKEGLHERARKTFEQVKTLNPDFLTETDTEPASEDRQARAEHVKAV